MTEPNILKIKCFSYANAVIGKIKNRRVGVVEHNGESRLYFANHNENAVKAVNDGHPVIYKTVKEDKVLYCELPLSEEAIICLYETLRIYLERKKYNTKTL